MRNTNGSMIKTLPELRKKKKAQVKKPKRKRKKAAIRISRKEKSCRSL